MAHSLHASLKSDVELDRSHTMNESVSQTS